MMTLDLDIDTVIPCRSAPPELLSSNATLKIAREAREAIRELTINH